MKKVAMIGNNVASVIASIPKIAGEQFVKTKAELEGKGVSQARRLKPLREFAKSTLVEALGARRPEPTSNMIRTRDGHPMIYYDDGSLRHAVGKPSKKLRKLAKRRRHAAGQR